MSNKDEDRSKLLRAKQGDQLAANDLVTKYFERVLKAAEKRLSMHRLRVTDADDIAVSVFESLVRKIDEKKYKEDDLETSEDLWRLLCKMIQFKVIDHQRKEGALKYGGGQLRGESVFQALDRSQAPGFDLQPDGGFSPDQIIVFEEGAEGLLALLETEELRTVAVMRMENYKISEIAGHFKKSDRWVGRKLDTIRVTWKKFLMDQEERMDGDA